MKTADKVLIEELQELKQEVGNLLITKEFQKFLSLQSILFLNDINTMLALILKG
jgi:hypothetical protein